MATKSNGLQELFRVMKKLPEKLPSLLGNCVCVVKPDKWSLTHQGVKVMNNFYLIGIIVINCNNASNRFVLQPLLNVRILLSILGRSEGVAGFLTKLFLSKIFLYL